MKIFVIVFISLVNLIHIKLVTSQQDLIGDFCTLQATGAQGQCQLLSNCPVAVSALQAQGVFPQTCGFLGPQPIVCCTGIIPPVTTAKPTKPTTKKPLPTTKPTGLAIGEKSRRKCLEYSKYAEEEVVPIPGQPPIRTLDCPIEAITNIVGGTETKPKEFPHMALLGFDGDDNKIAWQCGGSLISERFVLTAAHCLYDLQLGDVKYVRIGDLELDTDRDDAQPQEFTISQKIRHPEYKPPSQYNDIALLQLNKAANLNTYARPACLYIKPSMSATFAVASGWGKIGFTDDISKKLLKVTLEFFPQAECNNSYRKNIGNRLQYGIVEESQVCAGSHTEKKDTCQGDSGGPLQITEAQYEDACMYSLVGITSFGKGCGVIPGVYTRISHYIEWIEKTVWP